MRDGSSCEPSVSTSDGVTSAPPRLRIALLLAAVAVAFADSSIVVLAVPQLLGSFSRSVAAVSWVITSFNLAVVIVATVTPALLSRLGARRAALLGEATFLTASLACAAAPNLPVLVTARAAQGVGAAVLLAAAIPLLVELSGDPVRGVRLWSATAAVGAALGPTLGGLLTELFGWRAIFIAQAPLAAAAFRVVASTRTAAAGTKLKERARFGQPKGERGKHEQEGAGPSRVALALALVSGALVGALFLVVVLLIDVWTLSPLRAALVVSAMPVATLSGRWFLRRLDWATAAAGGAVLLVLALIALAFLPGQQLGFAMAALALGGLGLGLAVPSLTERSLRGMQDVSSTGSRSLAVRHAGLVLVLLCSAPLLGHDLSLSKRQAVVSGARTLLSAPLPMAVKLPLALDLADSLRSAPESRLPNLRPVFDRHLARSDVAGQQLYRSLDSGTRNALTGSFRRTFFLCALMAALAALVVRFRRRE